MSTVKTILIMSMLLWPLCGCAGLNFTGKKDSSQARISLEEKERRIQDLESLLSAREARIKEQDEQIRQLKEKLRSLGVF